MVRIGRAAHARFADPMSSDNSPIESLESRLLLSGAPLAHSMAWVAQWARRSAAKPHVMAAAPPVAKPAHGKAHLDPFYWSEIKTAEEESEPLPYAGTTGPAAPVLNAPAIETIGFDSQASTSGFYDIPPDSNAAVGPNHVIDVVNTVIEWRTKSGTLQNRQRLGMNSSTATGSFFASLNPADSLFDPKVVYDQYNGRFVVVALEQESSAQTSRILVAVSKTSDPNGGWWFGAINSKVTTGRRTQNWTDYPGLAVDSQAVYITGNLFGFSGTQSFAGTRLWIVPKSAFYGGGAFSSSIYDPATSSGLGTTTGFTLQPAQMFGTAPNGVGTFLVSSGYTSGSTDQLSVIRVSNPLSSPTFTNQLISLGNISNNSVALPGDVTQLGSSQTIDGGDERVFNAVWRNGFLYAANDVNPTSGPDAGQLTAHWYKISTANLSALAVADQGNISGEELGAGTETFYPWVSVDGGGNMAVSFAAAGPNLYAGAYYTGRLAGAPAGTTQPASVLAAGVDSYYRAFGATNRWGDYSGVAVDPADDTTFWAFGEYAQARGSILSQYPSEDGRWGTRLGAFSLVPPPTTSVSGTVYRDDNYSLTRDGAEAGMAGVTVFVDANSNGVPDATELSAVTDASGNYTIAGLAAGTYSVRVVMPGAFVASTGAAQAASPTVAAPGVGVSFGLFPTTFSGAPAYALRLDAAGTRLEISQAAAPLAMPTYSAPVGVLPEVTIATAGPGDSLRIDLSNGVPVPAAGLSYAGGAAATVVVAGSAGDDAIAVSPGTMSVGGGTVSYSGVAGVSVSTGTGNDTLSLNSALLPAVSFDLGTGNDALVLNSAKLTANADLGATSPDLSVAANGSSTITFAAAQHLAALSLGGTSRATLAAGGGNTLVIGSGGLTIVSGAVLDLKDNAMQVLTPGSPDAYPDLPTLRQYLFGQQLISSTADSAHAIGYGASGPSSLVFKVALLGDTNLDGVVNGDDFAIVDRGVVTGLTGWGNGDFNYDNVVDGADQALAVMGYVGQGTG